MNAQKTPGSELPDPADEARLIRECQQGKLESFEPLVKAHQGRLGSIAYHILRDATLAQDAVQTTLVKAWQNMGRFRSESAFSTWLHRLCVHAACDLMRKQKRLKEMPLPDVEEGLTTQFDQIISSKSGPDQQAIDKELKAAILKALDKLPEDQRTVIILREMHGLDYQEIAQTVRCPTGTAMSRLHHARRRLRELLAAVLKS